MVEFELVETFPAVEDVAKFVAGGGILHAFVGIILGSEAGDLVDLRAEDAASGVGEGIADAF